MNTPASVYWIKPYSPQYDGEHNYVARVRLTGNMVSEPFTGVSKTVGIRRGSGVDEHFAITDEIQLTRELPFVGEMGNSALATVLSGRGYQDASTKNDNEVNAAKPHWSSARGIECSTVLYGELGFTICSVARGSTSSRPIG